MKALTKTWTTPLVAGAFIISAFTGLLLFFHLEPGIVEPVHEWASWLIVIAALLHLLTHWKSFTVYLKKAGPLLLLAGGLSVAALSLYPWVEEEENPRKKAVAMLENARIADVAPIVDSSEDVLILRLAHNGIKVYDPGDSIEKTAEKNGKDIGTLFHIIFQ